MIRLGLNAGLFAAQMPIEEQLRATAAAGFGGIELMAAAEGEYTPETPAQVCAAWARSAADQNLAIVGVGSALFWQANYASPEAADRQLALDRTRHMLEQAAALRAEILLIVAGVVGRADDPQPRVAYRDAYNRTLDALANLRFDAESAGVTIAIENVWSRFLLSPIEAVELLDAVNSPNVGFCLDTGNILAWGYPQDWIRTLGRHLAHVHAKDYDLSKPGRSGFCGLGEGHVDWPAVLAALREVSYDGPLVYEGRGPADDAYARLSRIIGSPPDDLPNRAPAAPPRGAPAA